MGTGARLAGWLWALALTLACLLSPTVARAAENGGTPLSVCVTRAAPGMTPRALFAQPGRFTCSDRQTSLGSGAFWALSSPLPPGIGRTWPPRVRIASGWVDRLSLYALYADGAIGRITADGRHLARLVQLGSVIEMEVPTRHIAVTRLLWHVEGAANLRGVLVGAHVASPEQSATANVRMAAVYAAFAGLSIALLVYNFGTWVALRYRFQLAYCAMVAAMLVYAWSSSGAIIWMWPGLPNNSRTCINDIAMAISVAAALAFARSFFEPGVFAGWVGVANRCVSAAVIGASLLLTASAPWHLRLFDRLFIGSFVLVIALVGPVLWRAWHQRSRYLWLFALAWAAPIIFGGARVTANLGLLPWSFWLDQSSILSMMVEALLSSAAIAYRIRLLSVERDEAREQEIAARLLADTDPLTGLLNRRAFLDRAIGRAGEQMLVLIDVDHFKQVNETIGHDGGDDVLRILADTLRASLPPEALVARLGGEEFAALLPEGSAVSPDDLLHELRAARMPCDLAVTASIGTCSGTLASEIDWKALYRCADQALFEAKAAGRDRARAANPAPATATAPATGRATIALAGGWR